MKFDPTKAYGTIWGTMSAYPAARYSQGPFLYDAHRKCLNADKVVPQKTTDTVADATAVLKKQAAVDADKALVTLDRAKVLLEQEATPAAKTRHTKALKAYEKAQRKLEKLEEE